MKTTQGLRKIAIREWQTKSILSAEGLKIGVRFRYPYLKQSLQAWLDEEPDGEFANKLYIIGMNSRDPVSGHGYVELTSRWVSAIVVNSKGIGRISLDFSPDLTADLLKLLRREQLIHFTDLVRDMEKTLRAARHAGESVDELTAYARTEASLSLCLEELDGGQNFGRWIRSYLDSKGSGPEIMPAYI